MKCENCKKELKNPLIKCPYCGVDIPEYARAILRKESTEENAQQEAIIRKKRSRYVLISVITWAVGILVIFPVTFYFGLSKGWYWLPCVGLGLWVIALAYLGLVKGAAVCPYCGNPVGRSYGKYCPHCKKQFRD